MPGRLRLRPKKKLRGLRRRLQDVASLPERYGQSLPNSNRWGYLEYKLPMSDLVADGPHARPGLIKQCAQSLIDLCRALKDLPPPAEQPSPRIVASLFLPCISLSRVTLIWDEAFYHSFFKGTLLESSLEPSPLEPDLAQRWGLDDHLLDKACYQQLSSDGQIAGKIWFYGDIPGR